MKSCALDIVIGLHTSLPITLYLLTRVGLIAVPHIDWMVGLQRERKQQRKRDLFVELGSYAYPRLCSFNWCNLDIPFCPPSVARVLFILPCVRVLTTGRLLSALFATSWTIWTHGLNPAVSSLWTIVRYITIPRFLLSVKAGNILSLRYISPRD